MSCKTQASKIEIFAQNHCISSRAYSLSMRICKSQNTRSLPYVLTTGLLLPECLPRLFGCSLPVFFRVRLRQTDRHPGSVRNIGRGIFGIAAFQPTMLRAFFREVGQSALQAGIIGKHVTGLIAFTGERIVSFSYFVRCIS